MKKRNKKVHELKGLLDISCAMISIMKLEKLLKFILKKVTSIVNADRSTIFLVDHNTNELKSYIAQKSKLRQIKLPLGTGIAGWAAKTGRSVIVHNAYKDKRFNNAFDIKIGFRTKSVLCVPIRFKKRLIGVIEVFNKKRGRFGPDDKSLVTALASHVGISVENARLHEEKEILFLSLIKTLSAAIDARDEVTAGHSERVAYYSIQIGKAIGLNSTQLKVLECAALLHDIGKIGIKDSILSKNKKLSKKEFEIIKGHVKFTREILSKIQFPEEIRDIPIIASFHHELLDGTGYPFGLRGLQIPVLARIIAVADKFDAMTSYDRPYKKKMSIQKTLKNLKMAVPEQLDKRIVNLFIKKKLYLMERRKYIRINKKLALRYNILPETYYKRYKRTKNISAGGLLFQSTDFIPPGSYIAVRIDVPDKRINTIARVARANLTKDLKGYNIGIQFINLSPSQKAEVSKCLS